jgi:hypothetical protein
MHRRILVTGSRALDNPEVVFEKLYAEKDRVGANNLTVVHGHCPKGADFFASRWCAYFADVKEEKYPAHWETHGKMAGPIRNKKMVDLGADIVYAFPRGEARGTMNCVWYAMKAGIPVHFG